MPSTPKQRKRYYEKYKYELAQYYLLRKLAEPEKFKEYIKLQMRKWRKANPIHAKELNKKHQTTWRNKNIDLNRYRARIGNRYLALQRRHLKWKPV